MSRLFSAEFYEMGGWAGYVWPAYGVALVLIGALTWRIMRRNAALRRDLEIAEASRRRRRAAADKPGETP